MEVVAMLLRVIGQKFYEHSAGLLLFVFFLMFGVVEASQLVNYHWSLATGILQSSELMGVVVIIWSLYAVRAMLFVRNKMASAEYEFLLVLRALPRRRLFTSWYACVFTMFIPVVLYAVFMIYVGFSLMLVTPVFILMAALLIITLLTTGCIVWMFVYSKTFQLRTPAFSFISGKSYTVLLVRQLVQGQTLSLAITKIFSWACVAAFMALMRDGYDLRLPALGLLLGTVAHARLVIELRKFEDIYLSFSRNFPWPMRRRISQLVLVYGLIMTPEMMMLATRSVPVIDIIVLLAFTVSLLWFMHAWLCVPHTRPERYANRLFWLFMISFALVLGKLTLPLTVALGAVGIYWFNRYFPEYEPAV